MHWREKALADMTERDWKIFREDHEITIKGGRVPPPMRTWAEGPLPWELLEAVNRVGYVIPTAIQRQAIPVACQCRDLIGISKTGSGKTAAFVLPLLKYLKDLPQLDAESQQMGPYTIIMAPTPNLAEQIYEEVKKFKHFIPQIRCACLLGGTSTL